jgi:lipopolysaccharide transport system ATP-binding protein
MPNVIKVQNLSKAYQLGAYGTGTLSRDLERYWARLRGREDPFLKISEENDRTVKGESDLVWSLKDINFDIEQGDTVGVIGRNGAGKSTLLKIMSRITSPTAGAVKIKGRVASLLEVGTGFHAELSGRENVFLNGAILGMRKSEIKKKFAEIVEFSGVERFIDTPVKRYSSGMYVRLAFAVAAHLESEILIVDEVLSVGDAEFQKKCLGKMSDVSKGDGRTVLFVSHNMGAIKSLCKNALILNNGALILQGTVDQAIKMYTEIQTESASLQYKNEAPEATVRQIDIQGDDKISRLEFGFDERVNLRLRLHVTDRILDAYVGFKVFDNLDRVIFTSERKISELTRRAGETAVTVVIPGSVLTPGSYKITFVVHVPNIRYIELIENKFSIDILETGTAFYQYQGADYGCVFVECKWSA